jgi:hypothetical protein
VGGGLGEFCGTKPKNNIEKAKNKGRRKLARKMEINKIFKNYRN